MEEGYPDNLQVSVIYSFTKHYTLHIDCTAVCDQDKVINLTNHTYFNLAGHNVGEYSNHFLKMNSDFYMPRATDSVITGEIISVNGIQFEFREKKQIGRDITEENQQLEYDADMIITSYLQKKREVMEKQPGLIYSHFPQPILKKGKVFCYSITYSFSIR